MIYGYHEYKVVWYNPLFGEDLSEREVGDPHDYLVSRSQTNFCASRLLMF